MSLVKSVFPSKLLKRKKENTQDQDKKPTITDKWKEQMEEVDDSEEGLLRRLDFIDHFIEEAEIVVNKKKKERIIHEKR